MFKWNDGGVLTMYSSFLDLAEHSAEYFIDEYEQADDEQISLLPSDGMIEEATGANQSHAFFLFLKSFIGGAILALPSAFIDGGIIAVCSAVFMISSWNFFCMYLLYDAGRHSSIYSLGNLAFTVHPWLLVATEISLLITQCSFCITYFVFFCDCISTAVKWLMWCGGDDYSNTVWTVVWITCQSIAFFPLVCLSRLESLAVPALVADILLVICIFYLLGNDISTISTSGLHSSVPFGIGSSFGTSVGTSIFAFEGVGMVLPVAGCMQSPGKFPTVLVSVGLVLVCLYVSFGALGAMTYGSGVHSTVLMDISKSDPHSPVPMLLQIGWCLSIIVTFPLQLYPASGVLERFLPNAPSKLVRIVLVVVLAVVAVLIKKSFATFLSLSGVFCCLPLALIYPPLIHYHIAAMSPVARSLDIFLVVAGVGVLIFVTYSTFTSDPPSSNTIPCSRNLP